MACLICYSYVVKDPAIFIYPFSESLPWGFVCLCQIFVGSLHWFIARSLSKSGRMGGECAPRRGECNNINSFCLSNYCSISSWTTTPAGCCWCWRNSGTAPPWRPHGTCTQLMDMFSNLWGCLSQCSQWQCSLQYMMYRSSLISRFSLKEFRCYKTHCTIEKFELG